MYVIHIHFRNTEQIEIGKVKLIIKIGMFNRPFSFRGRIRRSEYGFSLMIYWLIYIVIVGIAESSKAFDFITVAFIPLMNSKY